MVSGCITTVTISLSLPHEHSELTRPIHVLNEEDTNLGKEAFLRPHDTQFLRHSLTFLAGRDARLRNGDG